MKKSKSNYQHIVEFVLFLSAIVVIWQVCCWVCVDIFKIWKPYAMPSPAGVGLSLAKSIGNRTLLNALGNSLLRGFGGYAVSVFLGMFLGIFMNRVAFLRRNLRPVIMGIQTLPSICWVPFSILWFGLTEQAIIFVVVMGSAFSMSIAFDNAIANVPEIYVKAAKTMGADDRQIFTKVIVPASMPEAVSGLKQGWSFAWRALMSGEVMTTCVGLGQTLITGRNLADINQVMMVMIVIVLVGIVIDKLIFSNVEARLNKGKRENL